MERERVASDDEVAGSSPAPPFQLAGVMSTGNIRVFQTRSEGSTPSSRINHARA